MAAGCGSGGLATFSPAPSGQEPRAERVYIETNQSEWLPPGLFDSRLHENAGQLYLSGGGPCQGHQDGRSHTGDQVLYQVSGGECTLLWTGPGDALAIGPQRDIAVLLTQDDGYTLTVYPAPYENGTDIAHITPPQSHISALQGFFMTENAFILVRVNGIQAYDRTGKLLWEREYRAVYNATIHDTVLYFTECIGPMEDQSNRLIAAEIATGDELWDTDIDLLVNEIKGLSYHPSDETVCYQLNNGVYSYDPVTGQTAEVADLIGYQSTLAVDPLKQSGLWIHQLLLRDSECFDLLIGGAENRWYTYRLTEVTAEPVSPAVTVLLPVRNLGLENAAAIYIAQTGVPVDFEYYRESGDLSGDAFVQFMNLRILSGDDNWDIAPLLFLPYWQYIQKGIFADLDELDVGNALHDSDMYYTNLFDACRIDGSLFYLPSRVSFSFLLIGDELPLDYPIRADGSAARWSDILAWHNNNGKPVFKQNYSLFHHITESFLSDFYLAQPDTDAFSNSLQWAVEINNPALYDAASPGAMSMMFIELASLTSLTNHHMAVPLPVVEGDERQPGYLQEAYAVNAKSQHKAAASELILALLQGNKHVADSVLRESEDDLAKQLPLSVSSPDEFIQTYCRVKEQINCISFFDMQIYNVIKPILDDLLSGTITVETAAERIAERVWLYANE